MKIGASYKIRQVAGENLVVGQGTLNADMTKVISLNSTAVLLWNKLFGIDFEIEDVANVLIDEFGIDKELALKDAKVWVDKLLSCNVIEK